MEGGGVEERADGPGGLARSVNDLPAMVARPESGRVRPVMMRSVVDLSAPVRILCYLTSENRQLCHPVGARRVATGRLARQKLTGGAARPWHCV
jgi:hypothetical protein